jgi:hypothetical protein
VGWWRNYYQNNKKDLVIDARFLAWLVQYPDCDGIVLAADGSVKPLSLPLSASAEIRAPLAQSSGARHDAASFMADGASPQQSDDILILDSDEE